MSDNPRENPIANKPDQHGFVMTGTQTLFLNHLAMFHMKDHQYQLILKVELPHYAMHQYVEDRRKHPEEVYILGNSQYDLMTLPQIHNGELTSFIADIFRGMPENPNTTPPLIHNVRVRIDRVVHYRHFDFASNFPQYETYILFGAGEEAHLTHLITKPPDYQQVLDLAQLPGWIPPEQLEAGAEISFVQLPYTGRTYCENPFTVPEYEVLFQGQEPLRYTVRIGRTYYFDTAVLNGPGDPCKPESE